jgi:endonuclease/exonuclease/phosphatase (EEP) superfamily protein YafD
VAGNAGVRLPWGEIEPARGWTLSRIRETVVAWAGLAAVSLGLVARYLPFANRIVLGMAALFPQLIIGGAVSVGLFAHRRRWRLAGVAATVTATAVATQIPLHVADETPTAGIGLRVMSANLRLGAAVAESLVTSARAGADVLAVQEVTPEAVRHLLAAGLENVFPYRYADPRPGGYGIGLWSRYPLSDERTISGFRMPMVGAKIQVPGVATDPVIVVVHLRVPRRIKDWRADIELLPGMLAEVDEWASGGAAIIAGDFNSTLDMRPFRDLLHNGYRDAADQAGAGFAPTFPTSWPIPLFVIDHVLTLRCDALSVRTVRVRGSDHRALTTVVNLSRSAA